MTSPIALRVNKIVSNLVTRTAYLYFIGLLLGFENLNVFFNNAPILFQPPKLPDFYLLDRGESELY